MDQKKIGEFLRELRKEKGMTQEQVAEHFNIAGRTVSRWETGSNMPDISIISEIADFYAVDIREIINGKRDEVDTVQEDVVSKVIEYADTENEYLARTVARYSTLGLVFMMVFVLIAKYGVGGDGLFAALMESISMLFVYMALTRSILFSTGRLAKRLEKRKKQTLKSVLLNGLLIIGLLIILVAIMTSFLIATV